MKTIKAYICCGKKQTANIVLNGDLTLKQGALYVVKDKQSYNISDYLHIKNTAVSFQDISLNDLKNKFHNPPWDGNKIWFDIEAEVLNSYFNSCCRDIRRLVKFIDNETIFKHDIKRTIDALNGLL